MYRLQVVAAARGRDQHRDADILRVPIRVDFDAVAVVAAQHLGIAHVAHHRLVAQQLAAVFSARVLTTTLIAASFCF